MLNDHEQPFDHSHTAWENGEAVPVTVPEAPDAERDFIVDELTGRHGISLETADKKLAPIILEIHERLLDLRDERAASRPEAEVMNKVFAFLANGLRGTALDKTSGGRALRRLLEGTSCDRSLESDARDIGTDKQNLFYHVKQLRSRLFTPRDS